MKFKVTKTSDWNYRENVDISTLEELMKFADDNGQLIISPNNPITHKQPSIEIYDDWGE